MCNTTPWHGNGFCEQLLLLLERPVTQTQTGKTFWQSRSEGTGRLEGLADYMLDDSRRAYRSEEARGGKIRDDGFIAQQNVTYFLRV